MEIKKETILDFKCWTLTITVHRFFSDFSLKKKVLNLKVLESEILTSENGKFAKYKMINENHLKLYIDGKSNDKDVVIEFYFYRLMPTITTLKKEDIEKLTFLINENGRESELNFNKELWERERLELLNKKEGQKRIIEQIDSTFFVSMYYNGERNGSVPIKEVTTEFLILYAIPTGKMEMIAYRKK